MFGIGVPELLLILVIGLVVFGPGKLPEVGKAIGKSLQEFKKATNAVEDATKNDEPKKIVNAEVKELEVEEDDGEEEEDSQEKNSTANSNSASKNKTSWKRRKHR